MNDESHVSERDFVRLWLLVIALTTGTLGGLEFCWRTLGHQASVVDDVVLWSIHRDQVYGANTVALLGASRMQGGFSIPTFRERFPATPVVQLAIAGKHPMAALRDLATDERFTGVVVCSVTEPSLKRNVRNDQAAYVRIYRDKPSVNAKLNRHLSCMLQARIALLHPNLRLRHVLRELIEHQRPPQPLYLVLHADRSRTDDYSRAEIVSLRRQRVATFRRHVQNSSHTPESWLAETVEIEWMVRRITSRGGRVAFVRFLTSGEHWRLSEVAYPKSLYWDRFATATTADSIHFADVAALRGFECPDSSHLDYRDVPHFTNALLDELVRRGVLPEGAETQ